jgi:hypothetical protein
MAVALLVLGLLVTLAALWAAVNKSAYQVSVLGQLSLAVLWVYFLWPK